MDELERRIRIANPRAVRRDSPLSERAEADLGSLIASPGMRTESIAIRSRPRYVRTLLGAMVAALVVGVLIVTGNVIHEPSASAAGLPLLEETPVDGTTPEIIDRMIMASRANPAVKALPKRRISYETWSANITVGEDSTVDVFVQPQEIERVWSDDLSGEIVTRAGAVTMGEQPSGAPSYAPGDVVDKSSFARGEYPVLFPEPPPSTAADLRVYLAGVLGLTEVSTAGEWFKAIQDLRTDWPLTSAQNEAILTLIKTLPDVTVAGTVTDRIGRPGIALQTETRAGGKFRDLLIFDSYTGLLNSAEDVYLGGLDDIDLPAMTVLNYTAWKAVE